MQSCMPHMAGLTNKRLLRMLTYFMHMIDVQAPRQNLLACTCDLNSVERKHPCSWQVDRIHTDG
jgi:hypothetical protein